MTHAFSRAELERKSVKLELKNLDEATGEFEGYGSIFNNEDLGGDVVEKGCFLQTLKERGAKGVKMLYEHDCLAPIGVWLDMKEDDRGLYVKGRLLHQAVAKAKEVLALMQAGALDGLSIGYRVLEANSDRGSEAIRRLRKVDLREISVVLFPMNEEAIISTVKAGDLPRLTEREFQRLLQRDAQLSRSDAVHVIEHGFKSLLKSKRDAAGEVASKPPDAQLSALADELRRLNEAIR